MPFPGGKIAPALLLRSANKIVELPSASIVVTGYAPNFEVAAGLGQYEPSGSWVTHIDGFLIYSRDGKNWNAADGTFSNITSYRGGIIGGKYIFLGNTGNAVTKVDSIATPTFETDAGGDGIGQCQWIAIDASDNAVARTTTQLRTSSNGILWVDHDIDKPANWSDIVGGHFAYSPTAGLFIACGSSTNFTIPDGYFTSANRTSWTQRTFPIDWTATGQNGNHDWFVDNGSIALMCMQMGGAIYSSTDLITWVLRNTTGLILGGVAWNEQLGAWYVITTNTGDAKVQKSTDGITWSNVVGNNLGTIMNSGGLAVDPVTGLMYCSHTSNNENYLIGDTAVTEDGITWVSRYPRAGIDVNHVVGKYGPVVDETITITPDPIVIADAQIGGARSFCRLITRSDGTIDRQLVSGVTEIGKWPAGAADSLAPVGREVKLDQISGDTLNFGTSALGVWAASHQDKLWGYDVTLGTLSGTFTLRYRDAITLVEDTNGGVAVSLSASSVA